MKTLAWPTRRPDDPYATEPRLCLWCREVTPHARRKVGLGFWLVLCRQCHYGRRLEE